MTASERVRWEWSSHPRRDKSFFGRTFRGDEAEECDHRHQYRWQAGECAAMRAAARNERERKASKG